MMESTFGEQHIRNVIVWIWVAKSASDSAIAKYPVTTAIYPNKAFQFAMISPIKQE